MGLTASVLLCHRLPFGRLPRLFTGEKGAVDVFPVPLLQKEKPLCLARLLAAIIWCLRIFAVGVFPIESGEWAKFRPVRHLVL